MAGIKNEKEKDKAVVAENTNSTETNVNNETTEIKEDKTYIYIGEEITKDGFILKYKGFYTSEQLNKIENGMSNYEEIKENFIDLDEYSEDK